ncbi:MAG: DnaB-like helicase C-terminal domain-containing protein [Paraclostridium sp.]
MKQIKFRYNNQEFIYPEHLTSELPFHEARVIGTLVNDMSLMTEMGGKRNLFHSEDGIMYYDLLTDMYNHRIFKYDVGAVQSALGRLGKDFANKFISINGNGHLSALARDFNPRNFESHMDALMKTNAKINLYKGLYCNMLDLHNDSSIKAEEVLEKMEDVMEITREISEMSNTRPVYVNIDDEYIQSKINGTKRGISYGLYSISKATRGLHLGNVSMLAGGTNSGKSTLNFNEVMIDLLDRGEDVFIYSNESAIDDFKDLLLIRTLTKHFKYYNLTRTKLNELDTIKNSDRQKYEEYMAKINEAKKYIDEHYHERLTIYSVSRYSIAEFNILMRRYALKGVKYYLIDTLKSESAGDTQAVGKLVQQSRDIYELARKLNTCVMVSYQIASYLKQNMKRVLDESCLSGSKQVAEILDILICMRELYPDEYAGQKNEIKVFKLEFDEESKKYFRAYKTLESDKKYLILFLAKNRYGVKPLPIVYEFVGEFGFVKEIGFASNIQEKSF